MANKNILTFKIGDETRPKVETLLVSHNMVDNSSEESKHKETPFFYDVYEKAITLVAEILQQNVNVNENAGGYNHSDLLTQSRNNIIAFVGDRGSGKTSSMKTIYDVLGRCRYAHNSTIKFRSLSSGYNIIKQYHILTLPTIDPSYFEARHNILDIVVAHMFDNFQKKSRNSSIDIVERNTKNKQELIRMFQEVKSCLDIIKQKPNELNETIEDLSALASGINLKESIRNLIKSYLKYFVDNERAVLAIAIDDIDLQTRYAYEMVEQIRKYLVQPNVLILLGVKISQLHDLVKQYYYNENHDLISANLLTDTPENMAGRYLSKLIPFNQRIFMPNIGEHCNKQIRIIENESISGNCNTITGTISSVVLNLIFIKTRYLFYHTGSNPSLIVPRNLRDLLNLA